MSQTTELSLCQFLEQTQLDEVARRPGLEEHGLRSWETSPNLGAIDRLEHPGL